MSTGISPTDLSREGAVFTRYLVGDAPSPYAEQKYVQGQACLPSGRDQTIDRFDLFLVRVGRRGGLSLALVDTYARTLRPEGLLRQKLILMLAILENSPPFHRYLNTANERGAIAVTLGLALRSLGFMFTLALGILVLGPFHLALSGRSAPAGVHPDNG